MNDIDRRVAEAVAVTLRQEACRTVGTAVNLDATLGYEGSSAIVLRRVASRLLILADAELVDKPPEVAE